MDQRIGKFVKRGAEPGEPGKEKEKDSPGVGERLAAMKPEEPMTSGTVIQVSLGPGGVPNRPVASAGVTVEGLEGDRFRFPDVHGLPGQAVLILTEAALEELKAEGFALFAGALGENLTVRGIGRREIVPGQRWRVGDEVILETTKSRSPCKTLDVYGETLRSRIHDGLAKRNDPASPVWGLSGVYARVITGGRVKPGDTMTLAG